MNSLMTKYVVAFVWAAMAFFMMNEVEKTGAADVDNEKYAAEEPAMIHPKAKYRVVMLRHGLSEANKKKVFSGWYNVELAEEGIDSAKFCGNLLKEHGYKFDIGFTSMLKRAFITLEIILEILGQSKTCDKRESYCLNELHFGKNTYAAYPKEGEAKYNPDLAWTYCADAPPVPLAEDNEIQREITSDKRYLDDPDFIAFPRSESLKTLSERTIWFWKNKIVPEIRQGKKVIVVTSAATLNAIVIHLEGLPEEQLVDFLYLKNSVPMIYEFDENMNVVTQRVYLENKDEPKKGTDTTTGVTSSSSVA